MIAREPDREGGATPELVSQIVREVPADLKQRIADLVEQRDVNMNDLLVGVLADRFGVRFDPSGRRSAGISDSRDLVLKVPPKLRAKIKVAAFNDGTTARDLIVKTLAEHLDRVAA